MPDTIDPLIQDPVYLLAILLGILAILFTANAHPKAKKLFNFIPLLVFAYFVPSALSNTGIIPTASPLYDFVKQWLLPAALLLMTMSVDIPAILRLGPKVGILFATATAGIVIGGPLAYLIVGLIAPDSIAGMGEEAWRGLAALSGSWIGGGANFVAIGESVGVAESTLGLMIVVDVAIANIWMAVLLYFAGRDKKMDDAIGADRASVDEVRAKVETFQAEVARPTNLPDLLLMLAIGIGTTAIARVLSYGVPELGFGGLPEVGDIISKFTWVVVIVTTVGVGLSFTRLRRLEGSGASAVGSVMLYLLVATIGAHADFRRIDEIPALVIVGALWMFFHASTIMLVRRFVKAPIFFAAVGSQANVGGAASAPIVASAFHPALAPIGVLLAVAGYFVGTYAGLACAFLLKTVHGIILPVAGG
jgi:uncharacterized membrane protein